MKNYYFFLTKAESSFVKRAPTIHCNNYSADHTRERTSYADGEVSGSAFNEKSGHQHACTHIIYACKLDLSIERRIFPNNVSLYLQARRLGLVEQLYALALRPRSLIPLHASNSCTLSWHNNSVPALNVFNEFQPFNLWIQCMLCTYIRTQVFDWPPFRWDVRKLLLWPAGYCALCGKREFVLAAVVVCIVCRDFAFQ